MSKILPADYLVFLNEVKTRIQASRIRATRAVNAELMGLYWDLGKTIVSRQEKFGWGQSVVEQLARDLTRELGSIEGFSTHNLWRMRHFYLSYRDQSKLAQLVLQIPWGHNILILQKCKTSAERIYYLEASSKLGWSRNVLLNQIRANAFRHSLKQKHHNFNRALPGHLSEQAEESIKSVYNLDFLGIAKPVLERELEKRLVERVKRFILELGPGFSFIGNQHRLVLEGEEYFIDLLFFHRKLKCLVAIELKTGDFKPEYAGKMDFYLHLLNDQVKLASENPSIGIILCAEKKHLVVQYALRSAKNPVGVAEYCLTSKLPANLKGMLPSDQELKNQIQGELDR